MSKHYTNYSNPQRTEEPVAPVVEETVAPVPTTEEVVEETVAPVPTTEEVVEETVAPVVEEPVAPVVEEPVITVNETIGTVIDCMELRVRKSPSSLATILCKIPVGSNVKIDLSKSTIEYYKVCTEAGVEGFCMKKFIAVV